MSAKYSDSFLPPDFSPIDGIPVITSAILHIAVLAFILPILSRSSTNDLSENTINSNNIGKVGVVALTPFERSQLPSFSGIGSSPNTIATRFTSLPPISSLPLANPDLPPPPPQKSYLPSLPVVNQPIALKPPILDQSSLPSVPSIPRRPKFDPIKSEPPIDDLINGKHVQSNTSLTPQDSSTATSKTLNEPLTTRQQNLISQRLTEMAQRSASLDLDKTNTTDESADLNYARWSTTNFGSVFSKPSTLTLTGNYPKDACLRQLHGSTVLGVKVDSQGNIDNDIAIIKSSGYPILNNQAIAQIQQLKHINNSQAKSAPFLVELDFIYKPLDCPGYTRINQDSSAPSLPSLK